MKFLAIVALASSCGVGVTQASVATDPVPQVEGKGLATAVKALGQAGFDRIKSVDASGRGRIVIMRTDWQVCGQRLDGEEVRLDVVKVGEPCPAVPDVPAQEGVMPDLTGKSIRVAKQSLPRRTSVKLQDATGQNRVMLRDTSWQVCGQTPASGTALDGRPVQLKVVKYGEACP